MVTTDEPRAAEPRPRPLAVRLLEAGIPLSLLVDLSSPEGPDSHAIAMLERP